MVEPNGFESSEPRTSMAEIGIRTKEPTMDGNHKIRLENEPEEKSDRIEFLFIVAWFVVGLKHFMELMNPFNKEGE